MNLADELEDGMDEYTLIDIIKNKLLSIPDKILLDAKGIEISDVLNGRIKGDANQEIYERLFSDWNIKLGRNIFGFNPITNTVQTKPVKYETLTLAFESKQEKVIFEEYLEGYAEWRKEYNKQSNLRFEEVQAIIAEEYPECQIKQV